MAEDEANLNNLSLKQLLEVVTGPLESTIEEAERALGIKVGPDSVSSADIDFFADLQNHPCPLPEDVESNLLKGTLT